MALYKKGFTPSVLMLEGNASLPLPRCGETLDQSPCLIYFEKSSFFVRVSVSLCSLVHASTVKPAVFLKLVFGCVSFLAVSKGIGLLMNVPFAVFFFFLPIKHQHYGGEYSQHSH